MHICQFCTKEFSNSGGLGSHRPYCNLNPDKVKRNTKPPINNFKKGMIPWNKGLTKETDIRVKRNSENTSKSLKGKSTGKAKSEEVELIRREKIKQYAISRKFGGYNQGSGRGKKGWYKGIYCNSSYELAYVIYHKDHGLEIERCKEVRFYNWEGIQRKYYPDFVVNNEIIEIKGYKTKQWEEKLKANSDIKVLYEKDLKSIFEYIILKYGKDFIELYEKGRPTQLAMGSVLKTDEV